MERVSLSHKLHVEYGRNIPGVDRLTDDGIYLLTFDNLYLFVDLSYRSAFDVASIYVPMEEALDDLWSEKRFTSEPDMLDFKKLLDKIVEELKIMEEKRGGK